MKIDYAGQYGLSMMACLGSPGEGGVVSTPSNQVANAFQEISKIQQLSSKIGTGEGGGGTPG
jgi:hypothetical protein